MWPFTCCRCVVGRQKRHQQPRPQIQRRGHEVPANSNQSKAKEDQKVVQVRIAAQTFQQVSSTEPWRLHRSNAYVGRTTCQMVVAKPKQEKAAPRAFIYAQNLGALNPTLFRTIVEAIRVSPMAGLFQDNRSAKFLH